ncbi:Glycerol phosphate dehydrogenase 2, mitochondrial, putative [Acanthamoeba castellanii str. Neff]|uniref:Glycerol-3-phosphate dehydrogenase n=1 Tax=Acanthamoeba castellanii (strain ATCC 30010 / Neff) TaxID=1257118 RepID=L8HAF0_ACACF|nr:Glycerol phosphate dehydrogenase 2, mitochondrial, putative [Acanthamoeba castellanii str. Neff]ELR22155.1 Glycerol phosphate dehydrogenase 2, mitochondrial, putative [Acanthamoeba castellanii str. Neff]
MWRRLKRVTIYAGVGSAVAAGGLLLYASSPFTGVNASTSLTGPRKTTLIPDFPAPATTLAKLQEGKEFDLLVVGGGATGAGIALDAATRGLNIALVEKYDFSSGTSSRSTKLVHGGVRYLEKAIKNLDYEQYKMVREALHERATVLKVAPHLSYQMPIMLPIYKWWQALEKFPMLRSDSLVGAMVYYDGAHNDSRTNIALALTAATYGATVANHVEVVSLIRAKVTDESGKEKEVVSGAVVRDTLSGKTWEVKAKGVINATGPFTDAVRKMDEGDKCENLVIPSAGVHIVLPDYYSPRDMGLLDPATSDGRVIFFLPWSDTLLRVMTPHKIVVDRKGTPSAPRPLEEEISFILKEVSNYLNQDVTVRRGDVLAAWSGIRPLVKDPTKLGKAGTQEMAEEAVDKAIAEYGLKPRNICVTTDVYLLGARDWTPTMFIKLIQNYGIQREVAQHLASTYGDRAFEVAKVATPTGKRPLAEGYPYLEEEVRHAVHHEYACTAEDVLARRTRLAFLNANVALDVLPRVIDIMAEELRWDDARKKHEYENTKKFLRTMGLEDINSRGVFNNMDILHYRECFDAIDTEHKGHISKQKLKEFVKSEKKDMRDTEIDARLDYIDENKDGVIEFNEFLELMAAIDTHEERDKYRRARSMERKIPTHRSAGGL